MTRIHRRMGRRFDPLARNPINIAIHKRRMEQILTEQQLAAYCLQDGLECVEMLGQLGWQLTWSLHVAANADDNTLTNHDTRILHSGLRALQAMCLAGYSWQAQFAPLIDDALTRSHRMLHHHPDLAMSLGTEQADLWQALVKRREIEPGTVVGAEMYQPDGAAA